MAWPSFLGFETVYGFQDGPRGGVGEVGKGDAAMAHVLDIADATRVYRVDDGAAVRALDGVSLRVTQGEFVCIVGQSGSGKSTLLHCAGGLDSLTNGVVRVNGCDIAKMSEDDLRDLRHHRIGFLFQFFQLVSSLTAAENVCLGKLLDGIPLEASRDCVRTLLAKVGLSHRASSRASTLSLGEMQRVAIARSLMFDPMLVLADEPTANLDVATGGAVMRLLLQCTVEEGRTLLVVTNDPGVAEQADRVIEMSDGRIISVVPKSV